MQRKNKYLLFAIVTAFVLASAVSILGFISRAEELRGQVLRLHVLANSNSAEDQALKLLVRDALLEAGGELFSGATSLGNAAERLAENQAVLQKAGEDCIRENGKSYAFSVSIVSEYFGTRSYGELTLPAGEYLAIKAVIGEGEGQNWWCVMFPPLCLPAAQAEPEEYFESGTLSLIESNPKIELRFKIVELFEEMKLKWFG
ncbi:MAG: stage II sporulation protein R [Clostridium sp.]|nr:stage II sporulation protein R [Clostridium sp.]